MSETIRVTVFGEYLHEKRNQVVANIYPNGMHETIAEGLREKLKDRVDVRTVTLEMPEHGLTDDVLAATDVLIWWGHMGHQLVEDEVAEKVKAHVLSGMGLVVLHSGHLSKPFTKLMGTSGHLIWREANDRELIWTLAPGHPIARGVPNPIIIPEEEMYGEWFDIPAPDELVFVSSFSGGEVFRSGNVWRKGQGTVFYFRPGHETYPTYHNDVVRQVIANGVEYIYTGPHTLRTFGSPMRKTGWFDEVEQGPVEFGIDGVNRTE